MDEPMDEQGASRKCSYTFKSNILCYENQALRSGGFSHEKGGTLGDRPGFSPTRGHWKVWGKPLGVERYNQTGHFYIAFLHFHISIFFSSHFWLLDSMEVFGSLRGCSLGLDRYCKHKFVHFYI